MSHMMIFMLWEEIDVFQALNNLTDTSYCSTTFYWLNFPDHISVFQCYKDLLLNVWLNFRQVCRPKDLKVYVWMCIYMHTPVHSRSARAVIYVIWFVGVFVWRCAYLCLQINQWYVFQLTEELVKDSHHREENNKTRYIAMYIGLILTLTVLVTTTDTLRYFETG